MDFNETQSYENVADRPEGARAVPTDTQSERLHAIKERVRARQKAMTKAFLDIVSELDAARNELPESKLKAFLVSECGLNRSDLRTYLKFVSVCKLVEVQVGTRKLHDLRILKPFLARLRRVGHEAG